MKENEIQFPFPGGRAYIKLGEILYNKDMPSNEIFDLINEIIGLEKYLLTEPAKEMLSKFIKKNYEFGVIKATDENDEEILSSLLDVEKINLGDFLKLINEEKIIIDYSCFDLLRSLEQK